MKWIKIVTDIFDDEKILLIEAMPDADSIIVIWFKLLCLAGKLNSCGVLIMNNRIVYTDEIEASAMGQIQGLCDQPFAAGSQIRIMPDVHTGKGCTIGTTMTVGDYVVPNLVGVDIGCGMDVVLLKEKRINLPALDSFISKQIVRTAI